MLMCEICKTEMTNLVSHIVRKHKMSCDSYREKFNYTGVFVELSEESIEKSRSKLIEYYKKPENIKKASDVQKNGSSCFTKTHWMNKGFSEKEAIQKVSEYQRQNALKNLEKWKPENSIFNYKHWMFKGMSESDAKEKVRQIQSNNSKKSSKFLGKTRTEESKQKISNSVSKMISEKGSGLWASHFGKFCGRSKMEIEFFNYIKENINKNVEANKPIGNYIVDVIIDKKIIEFNGDYWHANPSFYKEDDVINLFNEEKRIVKDIWEKDNKRTFFLKENGYNVLIIWENDWIKNKTDCVEKIKRYLYD